MGQNTGKLLSLHDFNSFKKKWEWRNGQVSEAWKHKLQATNCACILLGFLKLKKTMTLKKNIFLFFNYYNVMRLIFITNS